MRAFFNRTFCVTVALVTAVLCLGVFGQRLASAVRGPDFGTIYDYPDALYGIWKVQHGQTLYEACFSGNYNVTLVNFGFYHFYGKTLALLGIRDADVLRWGKFLTLLIAAAGVLGQMLTLRTLLSPAQWRRWGLLALTSVLIFWFSFTNWFVLSVRCDLPAVVATVWALYVYLRFGTTDGATGGPGGRSARTTLAALALASVLFTVGWSFKQVYVWSFSALALVELLGGQFRRLLALIGPFCVIVGASLWIGGRLYWDNTLVAPSGNAYLAVLIFQQTAKAVMAYPFIFLFGAIGCAWSLRRAGAPWGFRPAAVVAFFRNDPDRRNTALVAAALGATTMNVLTFSRVGGVREHIFEGAAALTTLALVTLVRLAEGTKEPRGDEHRAGNGWIGLAALSFAATAVLPLGQLLAYGALSAGVGRFHADFVPRPPALFEKPEDYARVQGYAAFVGGLPKPCLSFGILSLPWHSTDNQYPAFIINSDVHYHLQQKGMLQGQGWPGFYRDHRVRSLVLDGNDAALLADVQRHGYRVVPPPAGLERFAGHAGTVVGAHVPVAFVREGNW